jgi:hypothetical protein
MRGHAIAVRDNPRSENTKKQKHGKDKLEKENRKEEKRE